MNKLKRSMKHALAQGLDVRSLFHFADDDHDEQIGPDELQAFAERFVEERKAAIERGDAALANERETLGKPVKTELAFQQIDANGNGHISFREFKLWLRSAEDEHFAKRDTAIAQEIVQLNALKRMMVSHAKGQGFSLEKLFEFADDDKDKHISRDELHTFVKRFQEAQKREDSSFDAIDDDEASRAFDSAFDAIDTDNSGHISWPEFESWLLSAAVKHSLD